MKLIDKIDEELLAISKAGIDKAQYSHFPFKTIFKIINDEILEDGCNDFLHKKVSQYIHVFNDLCNTIVETTRYRILSFNKETGEVEKELTIYNNLKSITEKSIHISQAEELFNYYLSLELPEHFENDLIDTCKFDYLIRENEISYNILYDSPQEEKFDDSVAHIINTINRGTECITKSLYKNDRFEQYFDKKYFDINKIEKYRISFEQYIDELKEKQRVKKILENTDNLKTKKQSFRDHLINCDNKKDAVYNSLKELFKGAKGRKAATILLALKEKEYIILPERGKQAIYETINTEFNLNIKNQGYQPFINSTSIPKDEIDQIKNNIP